MAAAGGSADWPAPNFVDPPDRVPYIASIEIPLLVFMTLAVAARFYSRAVLRHILAWDDWLMLPAWVRRILTLPNCRVLTVVCPQACLTTVTVTSLYSTMRLNLTRHLWDVKPEWVMEALRVSSSSDSVPALVTRQQLTRALR